MNSLAIPMPKKIVFKIPFKAVTFQAQRYGNGVVYKTQHQKDLLKNIGAILMANNRICREFAQSFDPKKHIMTGQWFFLYENFFTKKEGSVSSSIPDLENGKKMVQDLIFKHMGLNDKDICHSDDIKWKGQDSIIFSLKLLEINEFQKIVENKIKEVL